MAVPGDMTIEKAMQLIKGGFSDRIKREFGMTERSGNVVFPGSGQTVSEVPCAIENALPRTR